MWNDYLSLARIDHWVKNIFVLPGFIAASVLYRKPTFDTILLLLYCIICVCLISSANYVMNEWIDARLDRLHPTKKSRPAAQSRIKFKYVLVEYFAFAGIGLSVARLISFQFWVTALLLLVMGVIYNLKPFRSKDIPYLDVLSESINNPLRFMMGWFAVGVFQLPTFTMLFAYWMGGAYLMALKRFAELRSIGDRKVAVAYRKSFRGYTEENLLISAVFYAICTAFFMGVLMVKIRIGLIIVFPLLSLFFSWYLWIAFKPDSAAQHPEKLFRENSFMKFTLLLFATIIVLLIFPIPELHWPLFFQNTK